MSYVVLARKYRPETFDDVVGQQTVARTLRNAITMDRIPHACLFSGPRGVGKTTMARIFAKALDCEKGPTPEPCNRCEICRSIWTGDDVDVVEIDGASHNSVEDIRELREKAQYTASRTRYKIYVIDEVHMLSRSAFNALLKTLEEPPAHVKFIFATTELNKVPETVQSRCQRFDFFPLKAHDISSRLKMLCEKESVEFEQAALDKIAEHAEGSMRDAESALDQVISLGGGKVTSSDVDDVFGTISDQDLFELTDASLAGDAQRALNAVHRVTTGGSDPHTVASQLAKFLRDLMAMKTCGADTELVNRTDSVRPSMAGLADATGHDALLYATRLVCQAERDMFRSPHPAVLLETCLLKLGDAKDIESIAGLVERVEKLAAGQPVPATPAPRPAPTSATPPPAAPPPAASAPTPSDEPPSPDEFVDTSEEAPPSPAPSADAPPPTPSTGTPEEVIRQSWGKVLEKLKEMGKQATAALFKETEPVNIQDNKLIVGIHSGFKFHKEHLEEFENRQLVEDAIEALVGTRYDIEFISVGDKPAKKEETAITRDKRPTIKDDPMVKKAIDILDAKIVSIKET
jgi:DNA polymerase-3 subunit gamma/tau